MRATLEIPDALFHRAKLLAVERRTTLKALITRGLEKELGIRAEEPSNTRLTAPLFELGPESPLRGNPLPDVSTLEESEAAHLNEVYRRR